MVKIMVFGAHADDTSACLGGTLTRLAAMGHNIRSIIATPANRETIPRSTRVMEAQEEHMRLGLDPPECLEFFNGELAVDRNTRERFSLLISEWEPDVVLTHWPVDDHYDHRAVACLAIEAGLLRDARHETICFEAWRSATAPQSAGFEPNYYVDTSDWAEKYRAIDAHQSQNEVYFAKLGENISDFYRKIDIRHGQQFGVVAAERFHRLTRGRRELNPELQEIFIPCNS